MKAHNKAEAAGSYWVAIEYEDGRTEYDGRLYTSTDEAERRALEIFRGPSIREIYICTI